MSRKKQKQSQNWDEEESAQDLDFEESDESDEDENDEDENEDQEFDESEVGLEEVEEDEEDEDEDEDEDLEESVEELEQRRIFETEAEEILEHLTLNDYKEKLEEEEISSKYAGQLKRLLKQVIQDGAVLSMEDAWDEALERLQDEI